MDITLTNKNKRDYLNPDLFDAAKKDDVDQLRAALKNGSNLDQRDPDFLDMTPIHLACIFSSNAFLEVAVAESKFDPWLRDANGRVAFDHAGARNNQPAMRLLFPIMHPDAPPLAPLPPV